MSRRATNGSIPTTGPAANGGVGFLFKRAVSRLFNSRHTNRLAQNPEKDGDSRTRPRSEESRWFVDLNTEIAQTFRPADRPPPTTRTRQDPGGGKRERFDRGMVSHKLASEQADSIPAEGANVGAFKLPRKMKITASARTKNIRSLRKQRRRPRVKRGPLGPV